MDAEQNDGLGARHLSQIKEESESREHSFPPPIAQRRRGPIVDEVDGEQEVDGQQEVDRQQEVSEAAPLSGRQQRAVEDNRSLLEELGRIEAELRETLRLDMERRQEAEFLQQHENMTLWQDLCYLSLSQRVAKPWVSSYFRTFPMHIYCLPVQPAGHQRRRRGLKKRK